MSKNNNMQKLVSERVMEKTSLTEKFIETAEFTPNQLRKFSQWINERKRYKIAIEIIAKLKNSVNDINYIKFKGKIIKGINHQTNNIRTLVLIKSISIETDHGWVENSGELLLSIKNNKNRMGKLILRFSREDPFYSNLEFVKFELQNEYISEHENLLVGFHRVQFRSAIQFLDKFLYQYDISTIIEGTFIQNSKQRKTILHGFVNKTSKTNLRSFSVLKPRMISNDLEAVIYGLSLIKQDNSDQNIDEKSLGLQIDYDQETLQICNQRQVVSRKFVHRFHESDGIQCKFIPKNLIFKLEAKKNIIDKIIDVKNLTVRFGKRTIIDNANFSIGKGEIIGIIGESGAGKSTTIKAILGEFNYEGEITILGINAKRTKRISPFIGYVPQDLSLIYHDFTPLENCIYFGQQYDLDEQYITLRAKQILQDLKIEKLADKKVSELSGGQKRRVSIAMAMIHDPPIIVLDEPTSGLDPMTRFELWKFLDEINKKYGVTLIVISHYLDEIEYSDKSAIYLKGIGFHDYESPRVLKSKLPGKGKAIEITFAEVNLNVLDLLEEINGIEEIIQRGSRIRVLSDQAPSILKIEIQEILKKNGIPFLRVEENVIIDMMDYFTIYSRALGSGKMLGQSIHSKLNINNDTNISLTSGEI